MKQIVFLLITLITLVRGQINAFNVRIGEFPAASITPTNFRCAGTIITQNHVLTAASCVQTSNTVAVQILSQEMILGILTNTTQNLSAQKVTVHPDFRAGRDDIANVAVLKIDWLNSSNPALILVPRFLGAIQSNYTCNLFGWSGFLYFPRRDAVTVYNSTYCDSSSSQLFCSPIDIFIDTCTAEQGSALVCGVGTIDGILISNQTCSVVNGRNVLNYHSVGDYREWIEKVVNGAEISAKMSILLALSVVLTLVKISF